MVALRSVIFICAGLFVAAVAAFLAYQTLYATAAADPIDALLPTLESEEGFEGNVYNDSRSNPSIGYGTLLPLTKDESLWLARNRLEAKLERLRNRWPPYNDMPDRVKVALLDMSYQEGVHGVLGYTDMLAALARGDWQAAEAAGLDSVWARETPSRARRVTDRFLP